MPNKQNVENVAKIAEQLEGITAMWVVDYRGLTVKESEALRRSLRESDAVMGVYKNTLMRLAMENAGLPSMGDVLSGPSAFIFAEGDPVASAKAVKEFAAKNDKLVIKGGVMEGTVYDAAQVEAIASLPSREQLYGQLAGLINGFARRIAVSINGVPAGMARALKQVAEQKPAA
ncbi:50S ribosomal protein L10 [uncultured Slackia sp.]|jgi:large subunit ribosomal protein L10|uniref:50S ribosomal protein L10 n=1 Tax=uncultured Slackia sp. TaxID=665903 RepID=UPI0025DE56A4|nr:50S ribosomal protein L10 [uncultured Slackia sp.]